MKKKHKLQLLQNKYSQHMDVVNRMMKEGKSETEVMEYLNTFKDMNSEIGSLSKEAFEEELSSIKKRKDDKLKNIDLIRIVITVLFLIYIVTEFMRIA